MKTRGKQYAWLLVWLFGLAACQGVTQKNKIVGLGELENASIIKPYVDEDLPVADPDHDPDENNPIQPTPPSTGSGGSVSNVPSLPPPHLGKSPSSLPICSSADIEVRREPTMAWKYAASSTWNTVANPIAKGIQAAKPGDCVVIYGSNLRYPYLSIGGNNTGTHNAKTPGGTQQNPITIRAALDPSGNFESVVIDRPNNGINFTLSFLQEMSGGKGGWMNFIGLTILGSNQAAIGLPSIANGIHEGIKFDSCTVDGQWDPCLAPSNASSHTDFGAWCNLPSGQWLAGNKTDPQAELTKWGVFTYWVKDFWFINGTVRNIAQEHGFYMHNPKGEILIENNVIERVGRTAIQITARAWEDNTKYPGPSFDTIYFRNNFIRAWGMYDHPHAITISGHAGNVVVEKNIVERGYELACLANKSEAYSGALVIWSGGEWNVQSGNYNLLKPYWHTPLSGPSTSPNWPFVGPGNLNAVLTGDFGLQENGAVYVHNNQFLFNPNPDPQYTNNVCGPNAGKLPTQLKLGDRPVVEMSAARYVELTGNVIQASASGAISIDPVSKNNPSAPKDPVLWQFSGTNNIITGGKKCFFGCPSF